jgi:TorA maturation chaperone TorD
MDTIAENLDRVIVWGALADALRRPEDEPEWAYAEELAEAAPRLGLDARPLIEARRGADGLVAAHDRLFGHVAVGPCPAYELEWGEPKGQRYAHELGDVSAFYRAFGLLPARAAHERPDHVATECEFLALLALKQACAEALEGADKAELCRAAARDFLQQHLGAFGRAFAARAAARADHPALREAARLLDALLVSEAARLGVTLGSASLSLRQDIGTPDDACISCGRAEGTPH